MSRCVATLAALAVVALSTLVAGCASPKPAPPKPPTESEVRAGFTAERSAAALARLGDVNLRAVIERHLGERARAARGRGARLAIETLRVGETMGIGGGLAMTRVFALYHEYDEREFVTYLEGMELVGANLRLAARLPVAGSGRGLAQLENVELNRAVLKVHTRTDKDPPCCPTRAGFIAYHLTGFSLEPAQ